MPAHRGLAALGGRTARFAVPVLAAAVLVAAGVASAALASPDSRQSTRPTIVLVHGAWADGSSWSAVVTKLQQDNYPVLVAPNPLRGLSADAGYLKDFLSTIPGPVVLVGHSYGGAVITNAATGNPNVKALVYDDAYIPDVHETITDLSGPNSALAPAAKNPMAVFKLVPYPGAPDGVADTYVLPSVFPGAFGADLPRPLTAALTVQQPPTSLVALVEPSGAPAWKTIPSWDIAGRQDKIIPLDRQREMAHRAKSQVTEIDSSHLSLISHPDAVVRVIETAARSTC